MKFRPRRQTKTQDRSTSTYSYYSNRTGSEKSSSRVPQKFLLKETTLSSRVNRLPTLAALGVFLASLVYILSLNSNPKIIQTSSKGSIFLQSTSTYEEAAHKIFARSLLNSNKITVDVNGIAAEMKKQFPELASVNVAMPLISHRPLVYINPSQPSMFLTSAGRTFVLNEKGAAVLDASKSYVKDLKIPTVTDQSNTIVKVGSTVLPADNVKFISEVYKQLTTQNIPVESITLPTLANQADIKIKGEPFFVKVNLLKDAKEQAGTFAAAYKKLKSTGKVPAQYFDVRVEGRVYYL